MCVRSPAIPLSLILSLSLEVTYLRKPLAQPPGQHTPVRHLCECMCVCESVACYAYSSSSSLLLLLGQLPTELPTYLFESLLLHIYDTLSTIQHTRYSPHDNINKNSLLFWQLSKLFAYRLVCLTFSCWEQQLKLALSPF